MAGPNNATCSDNPDPQFLIILLRHASKCDVDLARAWRIARARFDRYTRIPFKIRLTKPKMRGTFRDFSVMSKICSITGSRAIRGSVIHRRGMAKKKGGVG